MKTLPIGKRRNTPDISSDPYKSRYYGDGKRVLDAYFNDISKHEPLSVEEEQDLFRRYRAGDKSVKKKIILSNLRFVVKVAKRYSNQGMPFLDIISEGNKGLIRAVDKFDPSKNFKFISYAVWWIRQAILRALSVQSRMTSVPLNQTQHIVRILKAIDILMQKRAKYPTPEDISEYTGLNSSYIQNMLVIMNTPMSLDMKLCGPRGELTVGDTLENKEDDPLEELISRSFSDEIKCAIGNLLPAERKVIEASYGLTDGYSCTLNEIGVMMGFSRERARQLRERALKKMRGCIGS